MKKSIAMIATFAIALLFAFLISPANSHAQEIIFEENAIRKQIRKWEAAWNRGDAKAITALYHEDADRTYAHGVTRSGKSQILELYRDAFSANLPEDVVQALSLEIISVRLLTTDTAVVDYSYRATGIPIAPYLTINGRSTEVMIKRNDTWLRIAQRNWIPTTPDCMRLCEQELSDYPPTLY